MIVGVLPPGDPGVFRSLLLPEAADALAAGEAVTALTLTEDTVAVGALAGHLEDGRFQITSLYVAPDYRREGGGRMLLERLAQVLEGHASSIEISFTTTQEEHEMLLPFLEVMGFRAKKHHGETTYLTTLAAALRNSFFKVAKAVGTPFSQIDAWLLTAASKAAMLSGAPLPVGGLNGKAVDPDVSIAVVIKDLVQAYIAFDTAWAGGLTLSAVSSKTPTLLPGLLTSAAQHVRKKYPPETRLAVQAVNSTSASLIRLLLPEARPIAYTYYCPLAQHTGRR